MFKNTYKIPMIYSDDFAEHVNIAWRIEPGKKCTGNPLMEPKYPWESASVFSHGTILQDPIDGLWKAWYISTPEDPSYVAGDRVGNEERRLTYAVSKDGVAWERPELDLCPYETYDKTNILLDLSSGGKCAYASVFVNPDVEKGRRYEMFIFRNPEFKCPSGKIADLPLSKGQTRHPRGLYRYQSNDGIHWKPVEGPIRFKTEDSCYIYRDFDEPYTTYHKIEIPCLPGGFFPYDIAGGTVRLIARRTSYNGSDWSDPFELVLTPDWQDPQDTQFMELTPVRQGNGFVATVTVYHNATQTTDIQFAASIDGRKWWRPARRSCLELEPLGDYGGGMLWPMRQMVEEGDKLHLYYGAVEGLHGDIYSRKPGCIPFHGAICRATWEKGRLWAAVPASGGQLEARLITLPCCCGGKRLYINAVVMKDGELTAELLDQGMKYLPGYSRNDCVSFKGDDKCVVLRWNAGSTCPIENASVRFYLRRARLYGFEWRQVVE